jgi:tetratricopeptide (TPR) repeat protein
LGRLSLFSARLRKSDGRRSTRLRQRASISQSIHQGYNIQGLANWVQGNYPYALEYFHKSLIILEELGDKKGIAGSLHNIGNIYHKQGDHPRALEYYEKARVVNQEKGNKNWLVLNLQGAGEIYIGQGNYARALEHFEKSPAIHKEIGNKNGMRASLNNIGILYQD